MASEQFKPDNRGEQDTLSFPETKEEVKERAFMVLDAYGKRAVPVLRDMVRRGEGRQVIATVPGRKEDRQLGIDATGEHMLTGLVRDLNLPAVIRGEHNDYRSENMDSLKPGGHYVILPIDSFDNTSQYQKDLDTSPYTVVSAFFNGEEGEPIGGVVGDIKDNRVYMINRQGHPVVLDLETGEERRIFKSNISDIRDPDFTLATYLGSNEYSLEFWVCYRHLIREMDPKGILYAGGGAFVPALVARGAAVAYVMFNEPRTETDAGAGLALLAGLDVVTVDRETYEITPYRFDVSKHGTRDQLFIMSNERATTEKLVEELRTGDRIIAESEWLANFGKAVLRLRPDLAGALAEEIGKLPDSLSNPPVGN
ncbi:MAG: hypothetical protein UV66_C0009G0002 [Candidatus Woesebacteria bacterium GW2011_GWA1_43_12]|uniref:Uncharacterized protein n=1 Tax=Candidatus Woesebacteria bacterium GW2011_GWA1_43_12 TaxID=1618557 RepID=A0A0G1FTG2_9BACT|nr:MAG: hypothetical protein UV66_C0009G0002 [Candidatus Woesebacteria bacterium GW2011_GWA1_43_12]